MKIRKSFFNSFIFLLPAFIFSGWVIPLLSQAQKGQDAYALNKGEMLITNWNPDSDQDAAQINQLTLRYNYTVSNSEPVGKYSLQWYIGSYINYHGKRFQQSDLSSEIFSAIAIKSIKLKADVFSDGKYVTNIFINFPDISIKPGPSNASTIINNPGWNNVFERTYEKESRDIFREGFELRNLYIFEIEFEGFELLDDSLEVKNNAGQPEKSIDYNHPAQLEKKETRNKKTLKSYFMSDYSRGKKNSFRGLSWHASANIGGNYLRYPMIVNSYTQIIVGNVIANDSVSSGRAVGGIHTVVGGEIWPFFGNYIGLGLAANAAVGGLPKLYGSYFGDAGIKFYVGAKEAKLLCEFVKIYRSGTYYENSENIFENGSSNTDIVGLAEFMINRFAIGARFSLATVRRNYPFENRAYYPFDIDLMIAFDHSKDFTRSKLNKIWKINAWFYHYFSVGFELSTNYSRGGDIRCELENNFEETGFYMALTVTKSFDFFGRPYLKKK